MYSRTGCLVVAAVSLLSSLVLKSAAQDAGGENLGLYSDGQRPASAAIQRFIDESPGAVTLPPGTFLLDTPIQVDLTQRGYRGIAGSEGATRLIAACAGPALRIVGDHQGTAHPDSVKTQTWEKERFPIVSGFEILGDHEQADGIELVRTMKCVIRNVLIRRCRYGIHLVERNRNVIIADSHLYDCLDTGLFLDTCNLHQINILGNHISYNKRAGIRQFNGDVHNVQITGNDIEYNAGIGEPSGEIVLEAPEGIISEYSITGNTIQARPENPGANVMILGSANDAPYAARAIAISGNIIGDRDKSIFMSRACRTTIAGNTIYGGRSLSVHIEESGNIVIDGNNIGTRPFTAAGEEPYADGLLLERCSDCLITSNNLSEHRYGTMERGGAVTVIDGIRCRISNCQIIQPAVRGVHVLGGMGCVISDNTIAMPSAGESRAAIEIPPGGVQHLVQNNWISSPLSKAIAAGEASAHLLNNTLIADASPGETRPPEPAVSPH